MPTLQPYYVTCRCENCDGGIEFDAKQLEGDESRIVECPHCHLETSVYVPRRKEPPRNFLRDFARPKYRSEEPDAPALPHRPKSPEQLYAHRVYVANNEELAAI